MQSASKGHTSIMSSVPSTVMNRREALVTSFCGVVVFSATTAEFVFQTLVLFERFLRQSRTGINPFWVPLIFPLPQISMQTVVLLLLSQFHILMNLLYLTLFIGCFAYSWYVLLSNFEDMLRVIVPTRYVPPRLRHHIIPRKAFPISLLFPFGVLAADDLPIQYIVPPLQLKTEQYTFSRVEESCTHIKSVEVYVMDQLKIWLNGEDGRRVRVELENSGWEALIVYMAVETGICYLRSEVRRIRSKDVYSQIEQVAQVNKEDSSDPRGLFYTNVRRICRRFDDVIRSAGFEPLELISKDKGNWWHITSKVRIIDLDECIRLIKYILESPNDDGIMTDSMLAACKRLIEIRNNGFLVKHLNDRAFRPWLERWSNEFNDQYLHALRYTAVYVEAAAQRQQCEQQCASYKQAAEIRLTYAVVASNTLRGAPRGEVALQECLILYGRAGDIRSAVEAYYLYARHMENEFGGWLPEPKTIEIRKQVIGK
jgi:hypothetical protein